MRPGNVMVGGCFILLAAVSVAAGASNDNLSQTSTLYRADPRLDALALGVRDALRVRKDPQRNRLWVLTLDDVQVYDLAQKRLMRRIVLPAWSVVRHACMPDLALDRSGSAFIAANAHPLIWRIERDSFELKEYEISLQGRESWAVGFGALAFGANGALFALTSLGNSLWEIDVAGASANMVEFYDPPLERCTLLSQF